MSEYVPFSYSLPIPIHPCYPKGESQPFLGHPSRSTSLCSFPLPSLAGATPTVSSTSITFYDQTNYTVTSNTYIMRLNFNACTTLPPITVEATRAILRADGVPGGAGDCAAVYAFPRSSWCIGPKTTLRPLANGMGGSM
ncbi:unnamed protein product [Closterium sp. NIES-54]